MRLTTPEVADQLRRPNEYFNGAAIIKYWVDYDKQFTYKDFNFGDGQYYGLLVNLETSQAIGAYIRAGDEGGSIFIFDPSGNSIAENYLRINGSFVQVLKVKRK